jgi:hypothetical protein
MAETSRMSSIRRSVEGILGRSTPNKDVDMAYLYAAMQNAEQSLERVRNLHSVERIRYDYPGGPRESDFCTYCHRIAPCDTMAALEGHAAVYENANDRVQAVLQRALEILAFPVPTLNDANREALASNISRMKTFSASSNGIPAMRGRGLEEAVADAEAIIKISTGLSGLTPRNLTSTINGMYSALHLL